MAQQHCFMTNSDSLFPANKYNKVTRNKSSLQSKQNYMPCSSVNLLCKSEYLDVVHSASKTLYAFRCVSNQSSARMTAWSDVLNVFRKHFVFHKTFRYCFSVRKKIELVVFTQQFSQVLKLAKTKLRTSAVLTLYQ